MRREKRYGWFLVSGGLVYCMRKDTGWYPKTKQGVPAGAVEYSSFAEACLEVDGWSRQNVWPLITHNAKPERMAP